MYGFDPSSLAWIENYLSGRSQAVYIDGAFSSYKDIKTGVPQGSILGPLIYLLFTNDFPETVYSCGDESHVNNLVTNCLVCGGICCFADDSTYSVSTKDLEMLKSKLHSSYNTMANYLANNRLKLNDDKTQLLVMTTKQKRSLHRFDVEIDTGSEVIMPVRTTKLLGIEIQDDLKWSQYILLSNNSLVRQLNTRLSALKLISAAANFKERLMVTNGLFSSKLIYQICLWGGAEDYLLQALQVVQNKAVRFVTRAQKDTSLSSMRNSCGWLNVRQLVFYHSVILIQKTLITGYRRYIYDQLPTKYSRNTRLASSNALRLALVKRATLTLTERSFIHRASTSYNMIPAELRQLRKMSSFKSKLKIWVQLNYEHDCNPVQWRRG